MKQMIVPVIWILVIASIAMLGHFGGWWEKPPVSTSPVANNPQAISPDLLIRRSKLSGWNNSKKTWEVEAERIWQTTGGAQIYFENVSQGVIFSVEGNTVTFKATWARWEKFRNELFVGGKLEARVEDKILTTDELVMHYQTETLFCPREITVTGKNLRMRAGAMQLDLKNEILILEKEVEFIQDGDSLRANGIQYNLETEEFDLIEPEGVTLNL